VATDVVREAVVRYLAEGFGRPHPIPDREKGPRIKGWTNPKKTFDLESFTANVGTLLTNKTDIDCDAPEAVMAAALLLPPTDRKHGRDSTGISHYWYEGTNLKAEQFQDINGQVLIEIRNGNKQQTLLPPSVHPSGEVVKWFSAGQPGRHGDEVVRAWVVLAASVALVARHWPQGGRHHAAGPLAGFLCANGAHRADVERLLRAVMTITKDEEPEDRVRYGLTTFDKFKAGEQVTGGPTLEQHFPKAVVDLLFEWFAPRDKKKAPATGRLSPDDFVAFLPQATFLMLDNGSKWAASSITAHVKSPDTKLPICQWLERHRYVDEVTWAPGREQFLKDTLVIESGEIPKVGMSTLNLYRPPKDMSGGDPTKALPWLEHLSRIYALVVIKVCDLNTDAAVAAALLRIRAEDHW